MCLWHYRIEPEAQSSHTTLASDVQLYQQYLITQMTIIKKENIYMKKKIIGNNVTHIDSDTGEIICETKGCTSISDDQKTDKQKKNDAYRESHVLDFNKEESFVKMFTEITYKLSFILSPKEYVVAIALAKFVSYENNVLVNGYGNQQHNMDLYEIASVLKMDYTRVSRIISSLIKKGVLGQFKTGNLENSKLDRCYIANPYIYINGANPALEVYEYFNKSGWKEFISSADTM